MRAAFAPPRPLFGRDPPDLRDVVAVLRSLAPAWTAHAACRNSDLSLFFPAANEPTAPACVICAGCSVRAQCLAFALAENLTAGVWGGLPPQQRRALRRRLRGKTPTAAQLAAELAHLGDQP